MSYHAMGAALVFETPKFDIPGGPYSPSPSKDETERRGGTKPGVRVSGGTKTNETDRQGGTRSGVRGGDRGRHRGGDRGRHRGGSTTQQGATQKVPIGPKSEARPFGQQVLRLNTGLERFGFSNKKTATEDNPPPTEDNPPPTEDNPPPTADNPPPTADNPPPTADNPPPPEDVADDFIADSRDAPPPIVLTPATDGRRPRSFKKWILIGTGIAGVAGIGLWLLKK